MSAILRLLLIHWAGACWRKLTIWQDETLAYKRDPQRAFVTVC